MLSSRSDYVFMEFSRASEDCHSSFHTVNHNHAMSKVKSFPQDRAQVSIVASVRKEEGKDPHQIVEEQSKPQDRDVQEDQDRISQAEDRQIEEDQQELYQESDLDWRGTLLLAIQHASR